MGISQPVIRKIEDNQNALDYFELVSLPSEDDKIQEIIASFPTVYIHNWKDIGDYEVYIGESNNVFARTRQHYDEGIKDDKSWQGEMLGKIASLYIIGHEHFNKSMTLDIENRLMHYMLSVPSVRRVHNLRGNPQNKYYPIEELDVIFSKIWRKLRSDNNELFPLESSIRDSAIFKASPLHKLANDQIEARDMIVDRVRSALQNNQTGQIIFIEGEAGTGKTVLNSSTFYEIFCQAEEQGNKNIRCSMIVNHEEQITVYEQIASKLGLTDKYGEVVYKPTRFINTHSEDNPIDVAFIDEAHLLLTQGKQSYRGNNQLQDIMDRAKVTVVVFDENQILTTEQFWEVELLEKYRRQAKDAENYLVLKKQMRMHADQDTLAWIDSFTKEGVVQKIPNSSVDYEIRIFDSPDELDCAIQRKAGCVQTSLSRIIATYDWDYNSRSRRTDRVMKYWEVMIDKWHKPWNRELEQELSNKEKRAIKNLSWAEQPQTIGEVGSTFTIQGFDLNYAGVILGPSVKYRDGHIVFDPAASYNVKAIRNRTLSDGTKRKYGEILLQHEVRVLMTRGVNGLYIYACDEELRNELNKAAK
ncbi:MAG: DUF2075 domain-containing protein [Lachnospiraceae bacterium]|nr:DUF2075 domain-containing protein [Lachnospiraceae bacterium]